MEPVLLILGCCSSTLLQYVVLQIGPKPGGRSKIIEWFFQNRHCSAFHLWSRCVPQLVRAAAKSCSLWRNPKIYQISQETLSLIWVGLDGPHILYLNFKVGCPYVLCRFWYDLCGPCQLFWPNAYIIYEILVPIQHPASAKELAPHDLRRLSPMALKLWNGLVEVQTRDILCMRLLLRLVGLERFVFHMLRHIPWTY